MRTARIRTRMTWNHSTAGHDAPQQVGPGVAKMRVMNNDNLKDKIDNAADKAKDVADKAGSKIKDGAEKVSDKAHDAADKIKDVGKDLGKKVGG